MASIEITKQITGVSVEKKTKVVETIKATDVQIPNDAPARMKVLKADKKKWYLTIVYLPGTEDPFALFVHTNHKDNTVQTHDAVEKLIALAQEKGIYLPHILDTMQKIESVPNVEKLTRAISLLLRHGVLISNIVGALDKIENVLVGTFLFQIKKFLAQYIKDGQVAEGMKCTSCGSSHIVYSEGCTVCKDCGSSKCG
jgi:hypothetical protein